MHKLDFAPVHCIAPGELDEIISDGGNPARLWKECFHEDWAPIQVKECCGFKFVLAHHPIHSKASDNGDTIPGLAEFMAKHLKQYGWEYIVVDIQWYEPTAQSHEYHPFTELCMNEYGQLMPAENRFPSAKGGKGFAALAEYKL